MKVLLRLYPRAWRERYGEEVAALIEAQPVRPGLVVDLLAGAIDAHLSSGSPAGSAVENPKGASVMRLLTLRCSDARNLSRAEQWRAALYFAIVVVGISLAYVGVNRLWGNNLYVEALGIASFPIALMLATIPTYLRGHSLAARAAVTGATVVLTYLGGLLAAWT